MKKDEEVERGAQFRSFYKKDKNPLSGHTKVRKIYSPNEEMRVVHNGIRNSLRALGFCLPNATACSKGNSPLKNVLRHKKRDGKFPRYFYLVDISNAYCSVDFSVLSRVLCEVMGKPEAEGYLGDYLKRYCQSEEGGLVTGGPASPDLFNLFAECVIDSRLRYVATECHNLVYTRYLDDLTFSSDNVIGGKKRKQIREVLVSAGFNINHAKSKVLDLAKTHQAAVINGVGIERSGRFFLPRKALRELELLLHRASSLVEAGGLPLPDQYVIHGKMGVFESLTSKTHSTNREKRVLEIYESLCRRLR